MLRSMRITGFSTLTIGNFCIKECANVSAVYTQAIRWKRKPIWLPTAPSKLFRVPKRPTIPKEEQQQIRDLYNSYRTAMKSFRKYIYNVVATTEEKLSIDTSVETAQEDYEKCIKINNQWNEKVAADREVRLAQEREERKAFAQRRLQTISEEQAQLQQHALEKIRKAQALAPHIITRENIDEAIEKALNTIVTHDYAIDVNGKMYKEIFKKPFNETVKQIE